jgi:hypothetical protein
MFQISRNSATVVGVPVLHRFPSCMHAVASTPAETQGAHFALFPHDGGLPRFLGVSASALRLSRPAQRSLHVTACILAKSLT